jgi:hypothetical protein
MGAEASSESARAFEEVVAADGVLTAPDKVYAPCLGGVPGKAEGSSKVLKILTGTTRASCGRALLQGTSRREVGPDSRASEPDQARITC